MFPPDGLPHMKHSTVQYRKLSEGKVYKADLLNRTELWQVDEICLRVI